MKNPLLSTFDTPFEIPPFQEIKIDHYLPAIEKAIDLSRAELEQIIGNTESPTFENTIEAMELSGEILGRVTSVLFNLNSAETSDDLQAVARDASPLLSAFSNEVNQNEKLWSRVKEVFENQDAFDLDSEQKMLLTKTHKGFVRNGADLSEEKKARFKEVSMELAQLSLQFGENVLAETNDYELVINNESDLAGLPADVIARAKESAEQKDKPDAWIFTLQAPSYIPFMEHAENRDLREQLYKAYMSKALKGDERDNQDVIKQIISLRAEIASLLGYETYSNYVLEERMAEAPQKVIDFLEDLLEKALPKAKTEYEELKVFMKDLEVEHDLERWDWAFYSEKLRKKKYDLDDELTKPYFKLENVISGVFKTAEKLFDITFERNDDIPVYHKDVEAYEMKNISGEVTAVFLADFFPREGKRGGAWMTSYREEKKVGGTKIIPQVSIVCNFTPSSADSPSLLKFDEVQTLFHEFGHALHGMLADTTYSSLSGTSVYWDFVELPSQIFENWCYEKECLELFAHHYKTGELIPSDYIEKLKESAIYHEAYATVRQISFGLLDLKWHNMTVDEAKGIEDVIAFEKEAFSPTDLFPSVSGTNMSVQFSHIFGGGYASGYYSYKWAEVLDADAFSLFKKNGVFHKPTADSFKENILSKGGTEHPMELYKKFRGQEPTPEALLERAGLV
ncbi:MAG: M3 family metallopeptidase [Cyclobacteriaceae bacterium]